MGRILRRAAVAFIPLLIAAPIQAQSLTPIRPSGQTVTPVYEGWYRNPDGTYSLSFGYFNRNSQETLEIPVGADNAISPGAANQGQPTSFAPRRHWGVFTVTVPANFGDRKKVTWTLKHRGDTVAMSGSLDPLWQIDALEGEAGANNTPPVLRIGDSPKEGRGPGGVTSPVMRGSVGVPLQVSIWAQDDGRSAAATAPPVTLTWFKHQGPGDVTFSPATARVANTGASSSTTVTFTAPGDYVLRVRATDSGVASAGHEQCCWTNAFVKVTVIP
jgi:hypothetical protein